MTGFRLTLFAVAAASGFAFGAITAPDVVVKTGSGFEHCTDGRC